MIKDVYTTKIVWDAIGFAEPICILNYKGLKLYIQKSTTDVEIKMYIDSAEVMSTNFAEHNAMIGAISQCPDNARVLIGGLGFGLILIYLAESKKSNEVIVIEKDVRVLETIGKSLDAFFSSHYPNFRLNVIHGDIYDEISKNGQFDWIFIDITDGAPNEFLELSKIALKDNGIYTPFKING